jgi:hypothetical protein
VGHWLRAVLVLWVAWQGPLPWCHVHGSLASAASGQRTTPSQIWLAEHLRSHHGAIDPSVCQSFPLHFHFDFPASSGDPDQSTNHQTPRLPPGDSQLAHQTAFNRLAPTPLAVTPGCDLACLALVAAKQDGAPETLHFFDRFAPSLALPLRFCVIRC